MKVIAHGFMYYLFVIIVLVPSVALAESFSLPSDLKTTWCSTGWVISGSTYTCSGNGKVTFPSDAIISTSNNIVIVANAGFEVNNARLGGAGFSISLRAPNGGGHVKSAIGAEVSGYIETDATVELNGTMVGGYIKAKGNVNISGGSVEGRVTSTNNSVFTENTTLLDGATAHSGMSIKGNGDTKIKGDFVFTALNGSVFEGIKMESGSIGTASSAVFTNSSIGTPSSSVAVRVNGEAKVQLNNTTIYGEVHVPDWGLTNILIRGDSNSHIYGDCARFSGGARPLSDPARLCDGSAVPPDPVEPDECDVELIVNHMVAGTTQPAKIVIRDENKECKRPDSLEFVFYYKDPPDPPAPPVKAGLFLNGGDSLEAGVNKRVVLNFSEDNEASLHIEYDEVGRLMLGIHGAGQDPKEFVSRPAFLQVRATGASTCNPDPDPIGCGKYKAAGESFDLEVKAFNTKNKEVGNFEHGLILEIMKEGEDKFYPRDGQEPKIQQAAYRRELTDEKITPQLNISEVGIVKIQATAKDYLSSGYDVFGVSDWVGRFFPAWLELGAEPSQNIGCPHPSAPTENFTYQGQPIYLEGKLNVQGFNKSGGPTHNYIGDFWRFSGELRANVEERKNLKSYDFRQIFVALGQESASTDRVTSPPIFKAKPDSAAFHLTNEEGEFISTYNYSYARPAIPSDRDNPFRLELVVKDWHDLDDVYFRTAGEPPASGWGAGAPSMPVSALIANSEFRLGRIRTENAIHTGLGESPVTVDVPLFLEHWEGGRFETAADGCTDIKSVVVSHTGNLKPEEPEQVDFSSDPPVESVGVSFKIEEDSLRGTANLKHLLTKDAVEKPHWLCQEGMPVQGGVCTYSRNGAGAVEEVRADATVTFGIYKGSKPLIFRREVYR